MERRFQVFVSSTFTDLKEERSSVAQAVLSLGHFPAGMELFPASNDDQWTLIKSVIDDSDYYVLVLGARYGSTTEQGISYTEQEFDYAVSSGIPVLAFVHEDPESLPAKRTDQNDALRTKLEAFRKKVMTGRHVKQWTTPENLQGKVFQALSAETIRNPREGWVRGNKSGDPVRVSELLTEVSELKKALQQARTTPPPGSELYAQGDDEFRVYYDYRTGYGEEWTGSSVLLTWNQILYELGPLMMDEAPEKTLADRLGSEIWRYDDKVKGEPRYSRIDVDGMETIKIQLMALGLMRKSEKRHVPSDRNVYWQLTPFGEQMTIRLRAIRKGEKRGE